MEGLGNLSCCIFDFFLYDWSFSILKQFVVMVALPGSGKSTFVNREKTPSTFIFSTDDYIEAHAKVQGKTYSDVFKDTIAHAETHMNAGLATALAQGRDVIVDRTNLTEKGRRRILSSVPKGYQKIAIVIVPPSSEKDKAELSRRLKNRPGKHIPDSVMQSMYASYKEPSKAEGFDKIEKYDIWGNHVV